MEVAESIYDTVQKLANGYEEVMQKPIKVAKSIYAVYDALGEKYYVYKGEYTPRCGGFQWWIDKAHSTFEDTDTWCKVHCDDSLSACLEQIKQWEKSKQKGLTLAWDCGIFTTWN